MSLNVTLNRDIMISLKDAKKAATWFFRLTLLKAGRSDSHPGVSSFAVFSSFHSSFSSRRGDANKCGWDMPMTYGGRRSVSARLLIMDIQSFYKSSRWRRVRAAVLKRDKYLCRRCSRYGRLREATTVHHIVHLNEDFSKAFDMSNLISLCAECHNLLHPEKGGNHK